MKSISDQKKNTEYSPLPIPQDPNNILIPYVNSELGILSEVISKINDDILLIKQTLGI